MKAYLVKSTICHDGTRYKKGEFIPENALDKQSVKRLLFLNVIANAYQEDEVVPEETDDKDSTGDGTPPSDDSGETIEEILEINFELAELKEGAKELNLTFASNIKKAKLIDLIVEDGQQDYFLNQLED